MVFVAWPRATAWLRLWGLLLPALLAVLARAEAPTAPARVLAARAALASLRDVDALEEAILETETAAVESSNSVLDIYTSVHADLGRLFEAALMAVRHALAAGVAEGDPVSLAGLIDLDVQLTSLLRLQVNEPLFFWHGPKRLVLPKLRRLLRGAPEQAAAESAGGAAGQTVGDRLRALAAGGGLGWRDPVALLGGEEGTRPTSAMPAQSRPEAAIPVIGVAVQDAHDGLAAALHAAAEITEGGRAHLVVLPGTPEAFGRVGAALRAAQDTLPDLYVSLALESEPLEGSIGLATAVANALEALGRTSVDLLWVPYGAFKKQHWTPHQRDLAKLLKQGTVGAFGAHADVRSAVTAKKLLGDRSPAPKAWLTPHDPLRPTSQEVLQVARDLGVAVVGLPRAPGVPNGALGVYLEAAAGTDEPELQEATLHRWAVQAAGGLTATTLLLGPSTVAAPGAVLRRFKGLELTEATSQLLATVESFAQPEKGSAPVVEAPALGLLGLLAASRKDALAVSAPPPPALRARRDAGAPVVPSVNPKVLEDMDKQRRVFKENNHVIYVPDFFDDATIAAIRKEKERLWASRDLEANCNLDGVNRLGGYVLDHRTRNSSVYELIYGNEDLHKWVTQVNDAGNMWPSDFPIELREYGMDSRGMGCHSDLQMYHTPRLDNEMVVTIDNDSRCNVTYWDAAGTQHFVHTEGNSLMMVGVNAARHCVSPTAGGRRSILKFIYAGDYKKSRGFWGYTSNECDADNPNRDMISQRRQELLAAEYDETKEPETLEL